MTVTVEDIRALFDSDLDDAHLILEEGRAKVVSAADADDFRAGLTITSVRELRADNDLTGTPDDDKLATIAATVDQRIAELGA